MIDNRCCLEDIQVPYEYLSLGGGDESLVTFVAGKAVSVDRARQVALVKRNAIRTEGADDGAGETEEFRYDSLVVACGTRSAPEKIQGLDSTYTMCSASGTVKLLRDLETLKAAGGGTVVMLMTAKPHRCPVRACPRMRTSEHTTVWKLNMAHCMLRVL